MSGPKPKDSVKTHPVLEVPRLGVNRWMVEYFFAPY